MSGTQNIRDHNESDFVFGADTSFSPRYPVFNYPTPSKIVNSLRNNLSVFNRRINYQLNFLLPGISK